jgi:hypothetical protein
MSAANQPSPSQEETGREPCLPASDHDHVDVGDVPLLAVAAHGGIAVGSWAVIDVGVLLEVSPPLNGQLFSV